MKEQPEALRLADLVDHGSDSSHIEREVAAELRRLHAEHLEDQRVIAVWRGRTLRAEQQRDQLLEALKELDSWLVCACIATPEDMAQSFPHMQQVVSAAIAKAEGEQA
jgi:predicted nucleic acid-binding protein